MLGLLMFFMSITQRSIWAHPILMGAWLVNGGVGVMLTTLTCVPKSGYTDLKLCQEYKRCNINNKFLTHFTI